MEQPTYPQHYVMPNVAGDLQDRLDSITQQILSRTRLLHIIEVLNLYAKERRPVDARWNIERMRKDIESNWCITNTDELSSFNVSYSSSDPHVAQQVTSELTNLFISENLEVRQQQSETRPSSWPVSWRKLDGPCGTGRKRYENSRRSHPGDLPRQLESNLQILNGLQSQLQTEEDALDRAQQQNVYLDSLLTQYRALQRTGKLLEMLQWGCPRWTRNSIA